MTYLFAYVRLQKQTWQCLLINCITCFSVSVYDQKKKKSIIQKMTDCKSVTSFSDLRSILYDNLKKKKTWLLYAYLARSLIKYSKYVFCSLTCLSFMIVFLVSTDVLEPRTWTGVSGLVCSEFSPRFHQ